MHALSHQNRYEKKFALPTQRPRKNSSPIAPRQGSIGLKAVTALVGLTVLGGLAVLLNYGFASVAGPSAQSRAGGWTGEPTLYVVLVDVSASRPKGMIDEGEKFVRALCSKLHFGDKVAMLQIQQDGLTDNPHPPRFDDEMPLSKDPSSPTGVEIQSLKDEISNTAERIPTVFHVPDGRSNGYTDIMATLDLAGQTMSGDPRQRKVIIILSDMLQSTPQPGFEFENLERMPGQQWIGKQVKSGTMPDLAGACVLVVGPNSGTSDATKIIGFWKDYLMGAHASLSDGDYMTLLPALGSKHCGT